MRKLFLDTNIFIHIFTKRDKDKHSDCEKLIELIDNGKFRPYISNVVILETEYVLTKQYKISREITWNILLSLFDIRNISIIEKTNSPESLKLLIQYEFKIGDCFIATQIPRNTTLVTYDKDFAKVPGLEAKTPAQILETFPQ